MGPFSCGFLVKHQHRDWHTGYMWRMLEQEKQNTGMFVCFLDAELLVEGTLVLMLRNAPGAGS